MDSREIDNASSYSAAALNAQFNDPRMQAILDQLSRTMFNRSFHTLSPTMRHNVQMAAGVVQNSAGDMLGLPNGATEYSNIYQGLAGTSFQMQSLGGANLGTTRGLGNNTVALASQIHSQVFNNLRHGAKTMGGFDLGATHGLKGNTLSQIVGQQMRQTQLRPDQVIGVDFGATSQEMEGALQGMKARGINTNTTEYQDLQKALEIRKEEDRLNNARQQAIANGTNTEDNDAFRVRKQQHMNDFIADKGFEQKHATLAEKQRDGSLHLTTVTADVTKAAAERVKAVTGNIKELSEIFQTEDLNELQNYSDQLNLGNLTMTKNVGKVKEGLRAMRVNAEMTGRSLQEVIAEQADIVSGLAPAMGGRSFVNRDAVEYVQGVRSRAQQQANNGSNPDGLTVDEVTQGSMRSVANAREHFMGIAMARKAIADDPNMPSEMKSQLTALDRQFEAAAKANDREQMHAIAKKAEALTHSATGGNSQNAAWQRAAYKNHGEGVTQLSVQGAMEANITEASKQVFNSTKDQAGSLANRFATQTGDATGDTFAKLRADYASVIGNSAEHQGMFQHDLNSINKFNTTELREAERKKILDRLREQGTSEETIQKYDSMLQTTMKLDADTSGSMLANMNINAANDSQIAQNETEFMEAQKIQAHGALIQRQTADAQKGTKAGDSGVISGLVGDNTLTADHIVGALAEQYAEEKSGGQKMESLYNASRDKLMDLGRRGQDGSLENADALIKDKNFLAKMGVDPEDKEAVAALHKRLKSKDGWNVAAVGLEKAGMKLGVSSKGNTIAIDAKAADDLRTAAVEHNKEIAGVGKNSQGQVAVMKTTSVNKAGVESSHYATANGSVQASSAEELFSKMLMGTPDDIKAVQRAAKDGNVTAQKVLTDAAKNGGTIDTKAKQVLNARKRGFQGAVKNRDSDWVVSGEVTSAKDLEAHHEEFMKRLDNAKTAEEKTEIIAQASIGGDITNMLKTKEQLMEEGYVDEDGKFTAKAGKDYAGYAAAAFIRAGINDATSQQEGAAVNVAQLSNIQTARNQVTQEAQGGATIEGLLGEILNLLKPLVPKIQNS